MTKALPWNKAHVHIEPLLVWKGKTSNDPGVAPSEGSDKLV